MVGEHRCPIVDTWWQTETGGILITPLPGATKLKPGSATRPFFGVIPEIVDAAGNVLEGACEGNLVIADSWPGQSRTVYGDHARFVNTYFAAYPGKYFTGDGARRDADGYYWITGRVDDVINVSGHRMGTAEVESALVAHPKVSEAAVVGYPHDIKGQGIYAYVTVMAGVEPTEELRKELVAWVRKEIGPIASPDLIQFAPGPAEDPLGQDHAAHPAQDRGERIWRARRHLDARRSGRRRRTDRQPAEPRQGLKRPQDRPPPGPACLRRGPRSALRNAFARSPRGSDRCAPLQDAIDSSCAFSILVARMTAWVRLSTPSFCRIAETWALTVASETLSS